jgi:hypothetical protein
VTGDMADEDSAAPREGTNIAPRIQARERQGTFRRRFQSCATILVLGVVLGVLGGSYLLSHMFGGQPEAVVPHLRTVERTLTLQTGETVQGRVSISWNDFWNANNYALARATLAVGVPVPAGDAQEPTTPSSAAPTSDPQPFVDPVVKLQVDGHSYPCIAPCEIRLDPSCPQGCKFDSLIHVSLVAPPKSSVTIVVMLAVIPELTHDVPSDLKMALEVGP